MHSQNKKIPVQTKASEKNFRSLWIGLAVLFCLTLSMFAPELFTMKRIVLSSEGADIASQFLHWREFGFNQLREGNLALWNPHIYSGAPYFGGFQSALLYPPNFLFLVLPVERATNWSIALHVFLMGAFTLLWVRQRGLHPLSCFLSAIMVMFGGAHFFHIYAGHLPNLCAMVWVPLIFLAIDQIFEKPSLRPVLLGTFAAAMQVFAGHPQYVFYTAIAAGIYVGLRLIKSSTRQKIVLSLVAIGVGAIGLTAVQLFTGIAESKETIRSLGLPREIAAMFSFPPENLLTLIAPNFFGDLKTIPYWGRCYLWEMSLFGGIGGLMLACFGAITGERKQRLLPIMILTLFFLACVARTPLFDFFYDWIPGFDKFRGTSKFVFHAMLFVALLAGLGLDEIIKRKNNLRRFATAGFVAAFLLFAGAFWIKQASSNPSTENGWEKNFQLVRESNESYLPEHFFSEPVFISQAASLAAKSLVVAGATFACFSILLLMVRRFPAASITLVFFAAVELFIFARSTVSTFDLSQIRSSELDKFLKESPGDYRVLNLPRSNEAMTLGLQEIWGYDPTIPLRYAQFINFTQGQDPDAPSGYVSFSRLHPLYLMLRCQFAFSPSASNDLKFVRTRNFMPRLQLVQCYRVISQRDEIFAAMKSPTFNPRDEVILEQTPDPAPQSSERVGTVELIDSSTDHLSIKATLPSASILLITDSYSKHWRVRSLASGEQSNYEILPANYCLRAIPLAAGNHHLRIEYLPRAFVIGKWISIASTILFAGLVGWTFRKRRS